MIVTHDKRIIAIRARRPQRDIPRGLPRKVFEAVDLLEAAAILADVQFIGKVDKLTGVHAYRLIIVPGWSILFEWKDGHARNVRLE